MPAVLEVASDIHCPWAYVCVLRLRRTRDALGLDVALRHLYWPLELVNRRGTPRHILEAEIPVLAQVESDAFAAWKGAEWPSTFLPAFELVKAAEEQGLEAADDLDLALRRAFFLDHRNLSLRTVLFEVAREVRALDLDALQEAYDSGRTRPVVLREYDEVRRRGVEGSPEVYLPSGERVHNPGFTKKWHRGIPHVLSEDPDVYERLLREAASSPSSTAGSQPEDEPPPGD
jgi:predicted DsbA family dithiol-disulfide isomerase